MAEQLAGRLVPTIGFRGISRLFRQPAASTQVRYFVSTPAFGARASNDSERQMALS